MDFYVYEHWRPDTNICFYVGKGSKDRAWNMKKRNLYHKAIQSKLMSMGLSVDVRIIVSNLTEESAFMVERDKIAFYGRENLSNMTDGGEGVLNPSDEYRKKLAAKSVGNKNMLGKKHSDETKRRISEKKMGHFVSFESRDKMGAANRGKKRGPMPKEIRQKISDTKKRKFFEKRLNSHGL